MYDVATLGMYERMTLLRCCGLAVCLQAFPPTYERMALLQCGHDFHQTCIDTVFTHTVTDNMMRLPEQQLTTRCPMCRAEAVVATTRVFAGSFGSYYLYQQAWQLNLSRGNAPSLKLWQQSGTERQSVPANIPTFSLF